MIKKLGLRRVLLNHSSQSRWERRVVFHNVTKNHSGGYWIRARGRDVPVQRLYADTAKSALTGKMRLSNSFMAVGRV